MSTDEFGELDAATKRKYRDSLEKGEYTEMIYWGGYRVGLYHSEFGLSSDGERNDWSERSQTMLNPHSKRGYEHGIKRLRKNELLTPYTALQTPTEDVNDD